MTIKKEEKQLVIAAPNLVTGIFRIKGTAPYVQNRFAKKAEMLRTQQKGTTAKSKKKHAPRDINADYEGAKHIGSDGCLGIPAAAFRSALISACRVAGFQMTKAKLSVFIEADTFDAEDGSPLVHIVGDPEMSTAHVRLESGVTSIAVRPMWREWHADLRIRWDADQFTDTDICHLLMRAGMQVGIGEGRPDSKKSHGMGWGTFEHVTEKKDEH